MNKFYDGEIEKSPRIGKLVEDLYDHMPEIESDRAVILTESYRETEGDPIILRRAKDVYKRQAVNGKLETVVYNEFAYGTWHIPSELAIVTVDGQRVSPGDYLITLKGNETGGTLKNPKLAGLLYTSDPFGEDSLTDFFTKNPPDVYKRQEYILGIVLVF